MATNVTENQLQHTLQLQDEEKVEGTENAFEPPPPAPPFSVFTGPEKWALIAMGAFAGFFS